jgi:hypothetical protein
MFKMDFYYTLTLAVITTQLQLTTLDHCVCSLKQYPCEQLLCTSYTLQFSVSLSEPHTSSEAVELSSTSAAVLQY